MDPRESTPKTAPAEVGKAAQDPARVVGRYILTQRLGSGGMGDVWRAWEPGLARWVAVKFLKDDDPEEVLRFEREAQTAASLHHPNIAAVYEVGHVDATLGRRHYIAMELVDGVTLGRMPRSDRRRLVSLVRDAALAVHYAHEQGIIHRDLKPPNLMVAGDRIYVMDFGLARQMKAGSSLTASGMMIGTPSFMSPEQARGDVRTLDARTDVYGLGATLYDLLAGQPPFNQPNVIDIAMSVVNDEAKPLRKLDPDVDPELETIVMKCLEKEPARRYPTARAFADDLTRWLEGEPVQARPVSTWRRVVKKVRRNKAVSGVSAVLVVVVIVAAIALFAQSASSAKRSAALSRLATQWSTILERKRELRTLSTTAKDARRGLADAVSAVDEHIAAWPADPQGYYVRARGWFCLGDYKAAHKDIDEALRLHGDFRPAWTQKGMILLEEYLDALYESRGRLEARAARHKPLLDAAGEAFAKGWPPGREKEEAERWGLPWTREDEVMERVAKAVRLHFVENKDEAARDVLLEGLERYKAEEYVRIAGLVMGATRTVVELYNAALKRAPGYDRLWLDRGIMRDQLGDREGAIEDYTAAIQIAPDFAMAWNNRGATRYELGALEDAVADFTKAIEVRENFAIAYYNRGSARMDRRDYDGAKGDLDKAASIWPDWPEPRSQLGNLWRWKGEYAKALEEYDAALRLGAKPADLHLVRALARRDGGDPAGSLPEFDRAVETHPDNAEAWFNRAVAKRQSGDAGGAIKDYDEAIARHPKHMEAHFNRGQLRRLAGDPLGAAEDMNRAIELGCQDPSAWFQRAMTKVSAKDLAGALADFDEAIRRKPEFYEALANRGRVREREGNHKGAFADYEAALRHAPKEWSVRPRVEQWLEGVRKRLEE